MSESRLVYDNQVQTVRGISLSNVADRSGEQRAVFTNLAPSRDNSQLFNFQKTSANVLREYGSALNDQLARNLIEKASKLPDYADYYAPMLYAALYLVEVAGLSSVNDLTPEVFKEYSTDVLKPLLQGNAVARGRRAQQSANIGTLLEGDLLRYTRHVLKVSAL